MLYMPAPCVNLEHSLSRLSVDNDDDESSGKTIQSFNIHYGTVTDHNVGVQTQLSKANITAISSHEHGTCPQIKTLPLEDSLDTLSGDNAGEIFGDAVHVTHPGYSSSTSDLYSQLIAAASSESPLLNLRKSESPQRSSISNLTEDFVLVDYDSENTDFREESTSPSIVRDNARDKRTRDKRKSALGKTSNHFRRKTQPVRRLKFALEIQKQVAKSKTATKSQNAQALDLLRSVERTPRRMWDEDERELLCVINRWYCAAAHATELTLFTKVFNAVTGLDLDSRKIGAQFTHIRYYGGDAYYSFRRVFAVPFNDPMGQYAAIRALIESTADTHGLDLQRRQSELDIRSGMARYAEPSKTQNTYLNLVQKASQDDDRAQDSHQIPAKPRSIMGMAMVVQLSENDNHEIITDAETSPESRNPAHVYNPRLAKVKPHLTFRVWDAASRTRFIDGGFVAHAFLDWPLPLPSPIALDDPTQAGKILASLHLSTQGGTPVFISTASVSIFRTFC